MSTSKTTDFGSPSWDAVHKATEIGLLPAEVTPDEHVRHGRLMHELRQSILAQHTDMSLRYEALRKVIDGGSESMTHEDALEACILAFDGDGTHDMTLSRLIVRKAFKTEEDVAAAVAGPFGESIDALGLATMFHEAYERLAVGYGYVTRPESRHFNADSLNGKLMIATCAAILEELSDPMLPMRIAKEASREDP